MKKSKWGTKWSWVAWSTLSYMVAGAISIGVIFFRIPAYRPAEFIAGAVSGLLIGLITSYPLWKIVVKRKAST